MTEERTCRCKGQFAMHKPALHADRDGSEARAQLEREHERALAAYVPDDEPADDGHYPDAIGSLVNAAKAEGKAQRTIADLRDGIRQVNLAAMAEGRARDAAEERADKAEAALARVVALLACASADCRCGGNRASVPTRDVLLAIEGAQVAS